MINLEKAAGLPIQMRDDYSLVFENGLLPVVPQIREFSAMRNYLKDPSSTFWRRDVYHMYRDLVLPDHAQALHDANLQYDITVILPGKIGDEFSKTIGHYHPFQEGTNIRLPEVYEVIYGKAVFLFQSASEDLERLQEAYVIEGERGEKVVVPSGFGHITVNPGDDVLVLANIQKLGNTGLYEPYEKHNGGAYYVIQSEKLSAKGDTVSELKFVPNLSYNSVPPIKQVRSRELPQYNLRHALPLYFSAVQDFTKLDFLVHPANYLDELTPDKLFSSK